MNHNSRTVNSLKNIIYSVGNNLLVLVLGFFSRSVFLYCLSVDYLGIQGLFSDILQMLSLADLGFGTAMTFSMYKPLAEKDYKKLAGLTDYYKKVYRIIAIAITVIGVALIPFLQYLVNLDNDLPYLKVYYVLYLANSIASYLVVYKTCILSADQKGYVLTKFSSIFSVIKTIVMIIVLFLTRNYILYLVTQVIFTYLNNFYASHVAEKMYPFIKEKVTLSVDETKGIFKNMSSVFLYKISSVLINATDNTLISIIVGTSYVGFYSNYSMIMLKISSVVNTIFYSLTASLGNVIVKDNEEKRYNVYKSMQSISTVLSAWCFVCVFLLIQDLIKVWLGTKYMLPIIVIVAMDINFYFSIVLLPIWVFREATGLYQKTRYIMLMTSIINVILSVVLGYKLGLAGILFATSISRLLTYFWYEPKLLFKEYFGRDCIEYFVNIGKNIIVTILILMPLLFLSYMFEVNNWLMLILKGISFSSLSLIILLLIYRKSEGIILLRSRFNSFAEKKRKEKAC